MPKNHHNLTISANPAQTYQAAAGYFLSVAESVLQSKDTFSVALAGGNTPEGLYAELVKTENRKRIDWAKVRFFFGDERPVPPDHNDSNYRMARETLLQPLGIDDAHVFRIQAEMEDKSQVAQQYQQVLSDQLGHHQNDENAGLDLILLGLGDDAHTASLFPSTPALLETRQWVTNSFVYKLDCERITLTPMFINRAKHVCFLVTGSEKAEAVYEVLQGPIDTQRLPAQLIHPANGEVVWFLDEAAAEKLQQT